MQICLVLTSFVAGYYLVQLLEEENELSIAPIILHSGGIKISRPQNFIFLLKLMFYWFHCSDTPLSMQLSANSP